MLLDASEDVLTAVGKSGALEALAQFGLDDSEAIVELVNEYAVEYAKQRSAELVGRRIVGDEIIENPNAEWRIDTATRDLIRTTVTEAMQNGWSNDRLAGALTESHAFSDTRAEMIARTETAVADVQGNLEGWRATGQVAGKQWLTAPGCCDECQALNEVVVDLDAEFPDDGGEGPPLHPNCRCDVLPVLTEE